MGPRAALRGFDDDLIARDQSLEQLNAQQLHRVVPGRDDRHPAKGCPLLANSDTFLPERPTRQCARLQEARGVSFVPFAGSQQGEQIAGQPFPWFFGDLARHQAAEFLPCARDGYAEPPDPRQPFGQRPVGAELGGCGGHRLHGRVAWWRIPVGPFLEAHASGISVRPRPTYAEPSLAGTGLPQMGP